MKLKNFLIEVVAIATVIFTFSSCDDDFNSVGSEVIGGVNFQDDLHVSIPVSYSKRFTRVQTNSLISRVDGNLPIFHSNPLGVYNDPVFGRSTYGILTQVQPANFNPNFGNNAVLDSVVISIPYISQVEERESITVQLEDGIDASITSTTYRVDSLYQNQPFKLSIFQSNYFLRDFDPNTTERQIYYSNDVADNFRTQAESLLLYENPAFIPSINEIPLSTPDGDDENQARDRSRVSPRLRVAFFDNPGIPNSNDPGNEVLERFQTLFLDKEGSIELTNPSNFNNYFRGIYFKAEAVNNTGNLLYFNLRQGDITLYYTSDTTTMQNGVSTTTRTQKEYALSFSNNVVGTIKSDLDPLIEEELKEENQDKVNGEENLYLKGGDGSIAVMDLFNRTIINENGESENELDFLKRRNWLINDASLKFYVNQDQVESGEAEPERIFVFNLETGEVLSDYNLDVTLQLANTNAPINSISNHLGRITRDADDKGVFYRIRITQHIIDLIKGEVDNIKIGVGVSQNVNSTTSVIGDTTSKIDEIIPTSSIISHEGTILYGNSELVPNDKRLKLEIFYTQSNK